MLIVMVCVPNLHISPDSSIMDCVIFPNKSQLVDNVLYRTEYTACFTGVNCVCVHWVFMELGNVY